MKKKSNVFLPGWINQQSEHNDIVISTRIRLARNIRKYPFQIASTIKYKEKILELIRDFTEQHQRPKLNFHVLKNENDNQLGVWAERGLINIALLQDPDLTGIAVDKSETVSLLINEEDHLRIQVIRGGLDLDKSLKVAQQLDGKLNTNFDLAYHDQFGYLTACPTNVGTGLRASVMLHLPALALTRGIVQVLQAVLHMGLAIRGLYGEGTELRSVYFQISNQVTLGRSEDEIIKHLLGVTQQIIEREQEARSLLLKDKRPMLEDKVGRAFGILKGCRLLGFEESLDLLSALKLGLSTKLLNGIASKDLDEMLLLLQPAHIYHLAGKHVGYEEQLALRAEVFQNNLKNVKTTSIRGGRN